MPRYSNTLEVRFNVIDQHRWEIYDVMPSVADLSASEALKRDGWVFFVRSASFIIPYYFDARSLTILPFAGNIVVAPRKFRTRIGNGSDKEVIVAHGLNSPDVDGTAWEVVDTRRYKIECEIFKVDDNQMGFSFSEPPSQNSIEVLIG
jgi:hypothetical protein